VSALDSAAIPSRVRHLVAIDLSAREIAVHVVVAALVTARFFTERLAILPRWFNAIDLVAVPLLLVPSAIWVIERQRWRVTGRTECTLAVLFCAAWAVAWAVNSGDVHWIGATLFVVGLMWPVLFLLSLTNLGLNAEFGDRSLQLLEGVLLVNIVLGAIDAVSGFRNESAGADIIFGTFGNNTNQLAFFLAVMISYRVFQLRFQGFGLYRTLTLVVAIGIFLMCGFQTLWVMLIASVIAVLLIIAKFSFRTVAVGTLLATILAVALPLTMSTGRYFSVWQTAVSAFRIFDQLGKVELVGNVLKVWELRPWSVLTGVGPGSFNSRAFRSIAVIPYPVDPNGAQTDVAAALVEPFYSSDLSSRFIVSYFERGVFHLSGPNTDGPFTSYVSIPVEAGVPGALCLFGLYAAAILALIKGVRRSNRQQRMLAAWALANVLMLLGISIVDNYLETTRYTLLVWLSVAIWKIETRERRQAGGPERAKSVPPPEQALLAPQPS